MKLLCINDKKNAVSKYFQNWITEGEVYTVRRQEGSLTEVQRVLLNEIKNPPIFIHELGGMVEPGFARNRFVEVDDLMNIKEESHAERVVYS